MMAVFCSARSPKTKRTEKKLAILNSDLFLPRQRAQFRAKLSSYPSLNTRPKQMTTQQLHKIQKNRYFPSSPASGPSSPRKRRTTMVAQEASSSRASSRSALATTSWSRTRDSVRTLSWDRYDAREREREEGRERDRRKRERKAREFSFREATWRLVPFPLSASFFSSRSRYRLQGCFSPVGATRNTRCADAKELRNKRLRLGCRCSKGISERGEREGRGRDLRERASPSQLTPALFFSLPCLLLPLLPRPHSASLQVCRRWKEVLEAPEARPFLWREVVVDFGHELITAVHTPIAWSDARPSDAEFRDAFAATRLAASRVLDFVAARAASVRRVALTNSEGYWSDEGDFVNLQQKHTFSLGHVGLLLGSVRRRSRSCASRTAATFSPGSAAARSAWWPAAPV